MRVLTLVSLVLFVVVVLFAAYRYINPSLPNRLVISTGDGEGEYDQYAKQYQDFFKDDGVKLEIRKSTGAVENYERLKDPKSDIDVGFVQDGLGSIEEAPERLIPLVIKAV